MRFAFKIFLVLIFGLVIGLLYGRNAIENIGLTVRLPIGSMNDPIPINTFEQFYGESGAKKSIIIVKVAQTNTAARVEYNAINPPFLVGWLNETDKLVINGSYFNEDNSPSGYLVVNKKRIGNRLFDQNKSGLIVIVDGKITIRDLSKDSLTPDELFDFAVQSYPFLIRDSMPAIVRDTGHKARRSAIGSDNQNNIYFIVADASDLSLYEFMNVLLQTKIKFKYVLNLDGGPSSGMIVRGSKPAITIDSLVPIPFVISIK